MQLIKKETLAQVFSCNFCEIFKNTFFTEHLWWLLLGYFQKSYIIETFFLPTILFVHGHCATNYPSTIKATDDGNDGGDDNDNNIFKHICLV